MKKLVFLAFILTISLGSSVFAQVPANPEDISPLLIGETIPEEVLIAPDGTSHQVSSILEKKPTVILFYRGGWCPYCNAHLSDIRDAEEEILKSGFQLIAISPDSPENIQITDEKNQLNYQLFSDASGNFITAMGVAFKSPDRYESLLTDYSNGENPGILPVPSVFVVTQEGLILFEYINPNYKTRLSAKLLHAVLRNLD